MQFADLIGKIVGERYELLEVIGQGGQGTVYRARDTNGGREVAVKVLATRDSQFAERLQREQAALQALKGTDAVEVLDCCYTADGAPCLVMELLHGTDLETELLRWEELGNKVSPTWLLRTLDPIAETLHTAHRAGIVHRDLKPANIFLLESGGVRLLDFGLVRMRAAEPLTMIGTVIGSPSYIAPEVWQGQSDLVDHRADVYSLGVIVYRALTGEMPFGGQSMQDKLKLATSAERPSLHRRRPDLPKGLDAWIRRALAVAPEKRFSTVKVMWSALRLSVENAPPSFVPESFVAIWRAIYHRILDFIDLIRSARSRDETRALPSKGQEVDDQAPTLLLGRERGASSEDPSIPARSVPRDSSS